MNSEFLISVSLPQIYPTDIPPRHLVRSFYGCVASYRTSEPLFNQNPVVRLRAVTLLTVFEVLALRPRTPVNGCADNCGPQSGSLPKVPAPRASEPGNLFPYMVPVQV